jgi:hypothetical protein
MILPVNCVPKDVILYYVDILEQTGEKYASTVGET